jgi:hypothetical protein
VTFGDFEGRQILAAAGWDTNLALASSAVDQAQPFEGPAIVRRGDSPREFRLLRKAAPRSQATVELPKGCEFSSGDEISCDTEQPLSWADSSRIPSGQGSVPGGGRYDVVASAREFLRVLRDTRHRIVTRDGKRVLEPLGVTVSFEAVVEGFRGEEVEVRWSLYRTGKPVGRDWLVNRRVLSFKPKADTQRVAQEFWVPLPRSRASSFIRVTLYGPDQEPITRRDTKRFR